MNAIGVAYQLPPDKQRALKRAKRVEWTFIGFLLSIIVLMALVMGSSQTMKGDVDGGHIEPRALLFFSCRCLFS